MFVSTNRISAKRGFGDHLEKSFFDRGGMEDQPGFPGFKLWKKGYNRKYDEFLPVASWKSKPDFEQRTSSEAFRQSYANPQSGYNAGSVKFGGFEVRLMSLPTEDHKLTIPTGTFSLL